MIYMHGILLGIKFVLEQICLHRQYGFSFDCNSWLNTYFINLWFSYQLYPPPPPSWFSPLHRWQQAQALGKAGMYKEYCCGSFCHKQECAFLAWDAADMIRVSGGGTDARPGRVSIFSPEVQNQMRTEDSILALCLYRVFLLYF